MDGRWEEDLRFVWGGEFFSFFVFLIFIQIYILFREEEEKQANNVLF